MAKKEKKSRKKLIIRIALALLTIFIIYNLISFYISPQMSIIAHTETKEVSYEFEGIISRNEQTIDIDTSENGILDTVVNEYEMVKKGALIANYYDSDIDKETLTKLNTINKKISELKATPSKETKPLTEEQIKENTNKKIKEIINAASGRDIVKIKSLRGELAVISGEEGSQIGEVSENVSTMEKLLKEKYAIESSYEGTRQEILSPVHGIFSSSIDGYENLVNIDKSKKLKVSDYENLKSNGLVAKKEETPELKITDSFSWAVSVYADEEKAKTFSVGEEIRVRFNGESEEAKAKIEYISAIDSGKYIITAVSDTYSEYAMINRFAKLSFVKATYTGLYVPVEAIRVKDGVTGVYVKTENTVKYKEIEVIYKDDKDAIVKVNNTKSNALLLYDEIIVG